VPARDVQPDGAAQRVAEEVNAPGRIGQRLEAFSNRLRKKPDAIHDAGPRGLVALPVPEEVEREDAPLPREQRERERPLAAIRPDSVQEDERRRAAGARDARVEARDRQAARDRQPAKIQYFLMRPTTTPWTLTSPSAA
jgi:hypothetical protein